MTDTPQHTRLPRPTLQGVPFVGSKDVITDSEEAGKTLALEYPPDAHLVEECEKAEALRQKRTAIQALLEKYLGLCAEQSQSKKQHKPDITPVKEQTADIITGDPPAGPKLHPRSKGPVVIARLTSENHTQKPKMWKRPDTENKQSTEKGPEAVVRRYEEKNGPIEMNETERLFCLRLLAKMRELSETEWAGLLDGMDDYAKILVIKTLLEEREAMKKEAYPALQRQQMKDVITLSNRKTQARIYTTNK